MTICLPLNENVEWNVHTVYSILLYKLLMYIENNFILSDLYKVCVVYYIDHNE